jgi:NAD(P)-dependent dehydrogenase (short-subunit alcohol dehydrogenase family)
MPASTNFTDQYGTGASFDRLIQQGKLSEREAWNKSWNVNTSGTQVMTSTFVPLLLQASDPRILFVTSGTSTLTGTETQDLFINKYPPKGWPKTGFGVAAYRSAKTGMNMMMREWHKTLHEDGVKVFAISPGFLATGLGGDAEMLKSMGAGNPEIAGPFIRSVIEGDRDSDAGKVINKDGIQPW